MHRKDSLAFSQASTIIWLIAGSAPASSVQVQRRGDRKRAMTARWFRRIRRHARHTKLQGEEDHIDQAD